MYSSLSSESGESSAPQIPDNTAGAFEFLQGELKKLFGGDDQAEEASKLSAEEITKLAFDPKTDLGKFTEIKKDTIGNMEFSKAFSMDQNAPQFIPVPVAFGIATPIVTPIPINSPAKVVTGKTSPLVKSTTK